METLAILWFDFVLIGIYVLLGFVGFLLIQLISYKVFNFNLYKKICKFLEKEVL